MSHKIMILVATAVFLFAITVPPMQAQEKKEQQEIAAVVSVVGRLTLEARGKNEQLILHGKDAKTYVIGGDLVEKLKNTLSDLGKDNLVSLSGNKDDAYVSCTTKYKFDNKSAGSVDAQCIRYCRLTVTAINEAKKSNEEIPPAERDIAEEQKARASFINRRQIQSAGAVQVGQVKGIISAINFRSAIKTIKVTFRDKNKKPVNKNFIVSSETYIAKKQPGSEGMMRVDIASLRKGQEVSVGYSRDELKGRTDALFITIIKE